MDSLKKSKPTKLLPSQLVFPTLNSNMEMQIEKRSHPKVRFLKEIRDGDGSDLLFCEGLKLLEEAIRSRCEIQEVYWIKVLDPKIKPLLSKINAKIGKYLISPDVMHYISDLETSPGIIFTVKRPQMKTSKKNTDKKGDLFLILHGIQSPQNVGAMIRTGEAVGLTKLFVTEKTASPFNPKSIRASSGSIFRVEIIDGMTLIQIIENLKKANICIIGTSPHTGQDYTQLDWTQDIALIMGEESKGLSSGDISQVDKLLMIPMLGQVESLNVGAAAAICLFEAARQRRLTSVERTV
jgi:TrmH family RNA methyltransferase